MESTIEYLEMICSQINGVGEVRYQKMFGDYLIYVDEKPTLLVCSNTVFVKILPCVEELLRDARIAEPYKGAKPHYLLDIDNKELSIKVVQALLPHLKIKKKRIIDDK